MKRYLLLFYNACCFFVASTVLDETEVLWLRILAAIVLVAAASNFVKYLKEVFCHEQD